jgi:microsomal epoxide hydrolase
VHFVRRPGIGPKAPTGISVVGYENPPGVSDDERIQSWLATDRAAWYNHVNLTVHQHGGHFIPWEIPDEWVTDLRRTFRGRTGPAPRT